MHGPDFFRFLHRVFLGCFIADLVHYIWLEKVRKTFSIDAWCSRVARTLFAERARLAVNPMGRRLFEVMEAKQSNLCVAADVQTTKELLELANKVIYRNHNQLKILIGR